MDLFGGDALGRRRINLGGSRRGEGGATAGRADAVESARRERDKRMQEKRRMQAATSIQVWWRSRHAHAQERVRQRAAWDAQLVQLATAAQAGGSGVDASVLQRFIARFFFFSRIAPPRWCDAPAPPARQTAAAVALAAADLVRLRHLTRLMLASMRSANRSQHLGTRLLASPSHWLLQTRKLILLLLDHIGDSKHAMDTVSNEILLLWLLVESNQWPMVKTAGQSTPDERALIQQTQSALVASLVTGTSYGRAIAPIAAAAAASSIAVAPSKPAARAPPVIDLFAAMRRRVLDLTWIGVDNTASAAQQQHKTSVALLFATVIRCVTLCTPANLADAGARQLVFTSFSYHILSIPALPHRLRLMGLQQLLPSFTAPPVFDGAMEAITRAVRLTNAHAPSGPLSFARNAFASPSYSWCDTSAVYSSAAQRNNDMDLDSPFAAASSSSATAAAASSSASSLAYFPRTPHPNSNDGSLRISGVAWLLGNCLDLVQLVDESKSAASSQSFSRFLSAIEQLIQAVPEAELPALGSEAIAMAESNLPPLFVKQFSLFSERTFLDRLCRRLLAEPSFVAESSSAAAPSSSAGESTAAASSAGESAAAASSALNDVPIVCVLIDSILYKWGVSSAAILNTLVFSSGIVQPLWTAIQRSGLSGRIHTAGRAVVPHSSASASAAASSSSSSSSSSPAPVHPLELVFASDRFFNLLPLFCTLYGHLLLILDDDEFFVQQKPFRLAEDVSQLVSLLKTLLFYLYWLNPAQSGTPARLRERFSKLFVQLRDRQSRRPFLPPADWLFTEPPMTIPIATVQSELLAETQMRNEIGSDSADLLPPGRSAALISSIPFVLPFADRVRLLYAHIGDDQKRMHMSGVQFAHGMGRRVRIRRPHVLEDAFGALSGLSASDLKGRVQVAFVDEHGLEEAGLDGGGLFKEFLTTLFRTAFDPAAGLFAETPDHFLYPSPQALDLPGMPAENALTEPDAAASSSGSAHMQVEPAAAASAASSSGSSASGSSELSPESAEILGEHVQQRLQYFYFLGQMAAKALYDGIQIESQFALFFLRYCVGLSNYIDDLQGLDPQIHSSLMKLKALGDGDGSGGDIAALGLTFSVDRHAAGGAVHTVDLILNGSHVAVTAENKVRFIYLLSDWYLSRQLSRQASAFQQGMASVINMQWLRMFAAEELRLLLSGSQAYDLADLQRHTNYGSGYSKDHELIRWFWQVMEEFDAEQRGQLLRFATSCSRAPLLGFQALQPQFCIQRVNPDALEQNLPTASTCMNLLRVPRFSSKQRLKEKLLYAITTASHGFGLT